MALVCGLASAAGCASAADTEYHKGTTAPQKRLAGTIVDAKPILDIDQSIRDLGATASRVVYRSTSGVDGSPTEVSGAVFVPPGSPPKDGWPVIAVAHSTTGMRQECGPSLSPDLLGSAGLVAGYLRIGYAVTLADYQGLGSPGVHPYLDSKTAAFNVIDAVRALRAVSPQVSKKWAVIGRSQGGATAWAVDEQAATYGDDLDLVGAVALAPLADMTGMAHAAATRGLTPDQFGVYIWMLMGVADTHAGFPLDDYRRGNAKEKWDIMRACLGDAAKERVEAMSALNPDDLAPADAAATERLTEIFRGMALPQQRGAAPMLVIYGGKDSFVNADWTREAIARSCALGTKLAIVYQPDRGHEDLDVDEFAGWLMARFGGLPPPNNC
jgi:pimeloyl-ACP methyl ester carboxylesterase